MSTPSERKPSFRLPTCICGEEVCAKLRKQFHERNDLLSRDLCPALSFAKPKGSAGTERQKKTDKKKQIYEECFGRKLDYGVRYQVAALHFPVPILEYCKRLREERKNTNTRTLPSAPIAEADMIPGGLRDFVKIEYEGRDWKDNTIYFIPPCVSVKEVQYGLRAEQALARVQVDPLDVFENLIPINNDTTSDAWETIEDLTAATAVMPSSAKQEDKKETSKEVPSSLLPEPERTLCIDSVEDLQEGRFRTLWKKWLARRECGQAFNQQMQEDYSTSAENDLERHQQFLSEFEEACLPTDTQIVQALSLLCSYSKATLAIYQEWKTTIRAARKAADERLLISLANEIGTKYLTRLEEYYHSNDIAPEAPSKRPPSTSRDGSSVVEIPAPNKKRFCSGQAAIKVSWKTQTQMKTSGACEERADHPILNYKLNRPKVLQHTGGLGVHPSGMARTRNMSCRIPPISTAKDIGPSQGKPRSKVKGASNAQAAELSQMRVASTKVQGGILLAAKEQLSSRDSGEGSSACTVFVNENYGRAREEGGDAQPATGETSTGTAWERGQTGDLGAAAVGAESVSAIAVHAKVEDPLVDNPHGEPAVHPSGPARELEAIQDFASAHWSDDGAMGGAPTA